MATAASAMTLEEYAVLPPEPQGMHNRPEAEARFMEKALADADGDPCN